MRCILVFSALVLALVSARPEGYSYYTPHGGSGSGHGSGSATSSASLTFGGASALSSGSSEVEDCEEPSHEQLTPYQHTQLHYYTPQVSTGHSGSSSSSAASSSSSSLYLGAAAGHQYQQPTAHVQESVSGGSSGLYHYQTQPKVVTQQVHHNVEPQVEYFTDVHQHQHHQQQTHHQHSHHEPATVHYVQQPVVKEEIHKHVYVHVAPEEKEEIHQKVILPTYTKQKHYKIIFIKAPAPPTVRKVVLPQQPANEEKTLVYVLHKKPELEQEIVVPAPATSKPSKPEVYFIKYKTKKEEQHHHQYQHSYAHEETHKASSGSYGGSSTASSLTGSGGFEVSDLTGYGGSFSTSFAPIVVTEGSYHQHSTTPAPVKVTTVHSVLSSSAAPSIGHSAHSKAQSIKVSSVGLSGYSAGGSRQRGTKKPCSSKCSKASSAPLTVSDSSSLDAFVSNVF
uniref:DUF243 domain-containing protein n=1 Tax=Anopheles atroparvus TaxID=41427 RepID=A0AAG5CV33_ANOAO